MVGKIICPLILIEYTIFLPLPRIIVCASREVCMQEVNSSRFLLNPISN
uniref:Acetyl-CoA carboxylase carboxyltransferase beta subunit n=1 Tax=Hordeum vulgare TaxID=4513 RepID=A0A7T7FMX9_HORVU|nr:acetyl-CoA carboxylase carboxyltransferase beta subunit [Hordeum vulgare]QQL92755.1 acetyl-CoA carboxylase carboxyltransferase beta subunit [Hordeum vulgare]